METTTAEVLLREKEHQVFFVCHENMGEENRCDAFSGPCHERCMYTNPNGEVTEICMNCAAS